ncbi:uncharacterized protein LOC126631272 [Malus sylvestris]|uniref:uncharacterized protein LOC126631272 n=1 Tax=Malus sylvestris TaxID=3752 RepID=UPI0010AAA56D|nr:uncharacterized protein LOC114826336 [Malus domestica]XP_050157402.1 uncharacterized protein LOC126631272 [Malus sylvestris]
MHSGASRRHKTCISSINVDGILSHPFVSSFYSFLCITSGKVNTMGELEANRENNRSQEHVHENWNRGLEVDVVGEEITIKGRIQEVEKLAAKICQDKIQLNEDIAKRKCDRSSVLFRLEDLNEKGLKSRLAVEREKMNILQLFLLRLTNKAPQGKPEKPFMPREEISKHVRFPYYTCTLAGMSMFLIIQPFEFVGNVNMDSAENEFPDGTWNKQFG